MLERIDYILHESCLLKSDQCMIVAVSGGVDSLCLLDMLGKLAYPLIIAHLDHGLRLESGDEAKAVGKLASQIGADFILGKEDVQGYAKENHLSLEEAAREMRYRFLFKVAEQNSAQAVAVGHNADDQVETVLMHLLRGAGLSGLCGMSFRSLPNPWSKNIALVRPLLGTWREEILRYVDENGLEPAMDASNLDTRFYRNRLRHELIPYLESYNPGIRKRLWQMTDILQEDDELIQEMVDQAWQNCVLEEGAEYFAFDLRLLKELTDGVQRRLLRRAIQRLRPGLRNLDYGAIMRAQSFIYQPSLSGEMNLLANLRLLMETEKLWLTDWETKLPEKNWLQVSPGSEIELSIPAEVKFPCGWKLQTRIMNISAIRIEHIQNNPDPYQAWLDLDTLELPLMIRSRRQGERFHPLGMNGKSIKIADYMLNKKIPRRARSGWPLVISREDIVWVPGYQVGHTFRVTKKTEQILHLKFQKEN